MLRREGVREIFLTASHFKMDGLTRTAEILTEIVSVDAALVKRVSSRGRRVPFGRPEPGHKGTDRDNARNRSPLMRSFIY